MTDDELDTIYDEYFEIILAGPSRSGNPDVDDLKRYCLINGIECDVIIEENRSHAMFCFHCSRDASRFKHYHSMCCPSYGSSSPPWFD